MNMQIGCNGGMDIIHVPEKKHELKIRTKLMRKKMNSLKKKQEQKLVKEKHKHELMKETKTKLMRENKEQELMKEKTKTQKKDSEKKDSK